MNDILVESNYEMAYNLIPELLFEPSMIYIDGKFDNKLIKLFFDTGAQCSIITLAKAKKLGLYDYIDYKYEGTAVGVGIQKIIGRIHYFEIQIDNFIIPISVNVLEDNDDIYFDFDILIGLNVLYANGISIDIRNKYLTFNDNKIKYS